MDYLVWKWLHILSSTLLFGTGIGTAFSMFYANRSGDVRAICDGRAQRRAGRLALHAAGELFQPISGFVMMHHAGIPLLTTVDLDVIGTVLPRRRLLVAGRLAADPHAQHGA